MSTENKQAGILLDTHIWIRYLNGTLDNKPAGIAAIDSARKTGEVFISVISVWEVALLVRKKKLHLPVPVDRWVEQALRLPGIRLTALTPEIAISSVQLPDSLNRDPADRILVATARIERLRLMSLDKDILRFAKQTGLSSEKV